MHLFKINFLVFSLLLSFLTQAQDINYRYDWTLDIISLTSKRNKPERETIKKEGSEFFKELEEQVKGTYFYVNKDFPKYSQMTNYDVMKNVFNEIKGLPAFEDIIIGLKNDFLGKIETGRRNMDFQCVKGGRDDRISENTQKIVSATYNARYDELEEKVKKPVNIVFSAYLRAVRYPAKGEPIAWIDPQYSPYVSASIQIKINKEAENLYSVGDVFKFGGIHPGAWDLTTVESRGQVPAKGRIRDEKIRNANLVIQTIYSNMSNKAIGQNLYEYFFDNDLKDIDEDFKAEKKELCSQF